MTSSNRNFRAFVTLHAGLLSAMLFTSLLFAGCSGAAGSGSSKDSAAAASSGNSSSGGSGFSAIVDGKAISGPAKGGAGSVSLEQNSTIDGFSFEMGSMSGAGPGFQFLINNTGTTELRNGTIRTVSNYHSPEGVLYIDDSATVTITSGASSHVTGTFSGRWKNAHYGKTPADAPETLQITDGKFDLP
jgi:hypothetical protein